MIGRSSVALALRVFDRAAAGNRSAPKFLKLNIERAPVTPACVFSVLRLARQIRQWSYSETGIARLLQERARVQS